MEDNQKWQDVICNIKSIVKICKCYLSQETIDAVMHYVEHDEYEMAAEGLLIDIMKLGFIPENLRQEDCIKLAISCNLNNESVFCSDFWDKLINFFK